MNLEASCSKSRVLFLFSKKGKSMNNKGFNDICLQPDIEDATLLLNESAEIAEMKKQFMVRCELFQTHHIYFQGNRLKT